MKTRKLYKKAIELYETVYKCKFDKALRNRLETDIRMFLSTQPPKPRPTFKDMNDFLKSLRKIDDTIDVSIYCKSEEEYLQYSETVIIYDLEYEAETERYIKQMGAFYDVTKGRNIVNWLFLKQDLIKVLHEQGAISPDAYEELIKKHEPRRIIYD